MSLNFSHPIRGVVPQKRAGREGLFFFFGREGREGFGFLDKQNLWYEGALNVKGLSLSLSHCFTWSSLGLKGKFTRPGVSCCLHLTLVEMETLYLNLHHSYAN